MTMSLKQGFYLFTLTKLDVRPLRLSIDDAKKLISEAVSSLEGKEKVRKTLQDMLATKGLNASSPASTPEVEVPKWSDVYRMCHEAGCKAAEACTPVPMVVAKHANMLDDKSPVTQSWVVSGGVCGFAWVHLSKGNTSFASWCRKNKIGGKSYYGGWDIECGDYGQSMQKKEAYCGAFANELNLQGVKCYMGSRMD